MNVQLPSELEAFVEELVASGRYGSTSDAVGEALLLLQEREAKFQRLKRDIEIGLQSGPGKAGSFKEVAKRARKRWEAEQAELTAKASRPPRRIAAG